MLVAALTSVACVTGEPVLSNQPRARKLLKRTSLRKHIKVTEAIINAAHRGACQLPGHDVKLKSHEAILSTELQGAKLLPSSSIAPLATPPQIAAICAPPSTSHGVPEQEEHVQDEDAYWETWYQSLLKIEIPEVSDSDSD